MDFSLLLPVYLAVVGNCMLFGLACMQAFQYSLNHPKTDNVIIKLLVVFLLALNTAHVILVVMAIWQDLNAWPAGLVDLSMPLLWADLITAFVAFASQLFFTARIWRFLKSTWLSWLILAIFVTSSVYQLGAYIAFTALCARTKLNATMFQNEKLVWSIWGMAATQDTLISGTLIVVLYQQGLGALPHTVRILHRLTLFAINTGLWTSLCALFVVITMVALPNNFAWVGLYLMICPLYCNTVLANLNGRSYIRGNSTIASYSLGNSDTTREVSRQQDSNIIFAVGTLQSNISGFDGSQGASREEGHQMVKV
ncbi:hypothetical protein MVEN_01616000 [Mycena venus]|uniref:DUF6534 domain-containing protein n=1 Tax=Mycena venus TaxID=2733690 RepID=A0A8H6XT33_9AGAR|nr:hypothetical protein MVEN_01616000 [Mycena venus]